jgi:regulator of sirC expression with transglutaminase-like and TPR domain
MMRQPQLCRPEAIRYFLDHLPQLNTTRGLLHAAVGISMHALEDACPLRVDYDIACLARKVRKRTQSTRPAAVLAHLHEVLFEEEQFRAPAEGSHNPLYNYLPTVLLMKTGSPSTLALIYKAVGEELELRIEGMQAYGHFLVLVHDGRDWLIIDPSQQGRMLTISEARQQIAARIQQELPLEGAYLTSADHPQWIARILHNLVQLFDAMQRDDDRQAMQELLNLLAHSPVGIAVRSAGPRG